MAQTPTNMVTWFQLPADEEPRAWEFYERVFGWTPEGAYGPAREGAVRGEIAPRSEALLQPRLVVRVDDLDHTLDLIDAAGGTVTQGRTEIPEIGMVFAVFEDTEGNILNVVSDLAQSPS